MDANGQTLAGRTQWVPTTQELEQWLSAPRLQTYVTEANGDNEIALALYWWNSRTAAAAMSYACHLEVALRNAYDRELSAQFPDWASDLNSQLFRRTQGHSTAVQKQEKLNVESAKQVRQARRGLGVFPSHGKVLAALSFGFWSALTESQRTSTFWTPMLRHAFQSGLDRGSIHERITRIRKFRNRLAHNEPVFTTSSGLRDRLNDIDTLFDNLESSLGGEIRRNSDVDELIANCPVGGLV